MSWPIVKLGDVFIIARGGSPRPINDYITDDPTGVNWIMIGDTKDGFKYIEETGKKIRPEGVKKSRMVYPGDFLLTNSMSFGRPYILKTEGCIHDGWLVLSPKSDQIHTDYFYHYLGSSEVKNRLSAKAAGAVVKNLNSDIVRQLEIPLPPLAEQQRIAAILDQADALRRKRQQAIDLADQFLRSVFLEMFGDPVTNPKGWEVRKLSALCKKITDGTHHSPPIVEEGVPYITAKHLKKTGLEFFANPWFVSEQSHKEIYARCAPEKNDVLYIKDGATTGLAAINEYDFPFSMLSSLALLKPNYSEITSEFLCMFLNHPRTKLVLTANMAGAAITRLTLAKIKDVDVPTPSLKHQKEFSTIYRKVRETIARMSTSTENLDLQFMSLSQQAFSGQL